MTWLEIILFGIFLLLLCWLVEWIFSAPKAEPEPERDDVWFEADRERREKEFHEWLDRGRKQ